MVTTTDRPKTYQYKEIDSAQDRDYEMESLPKGEVKGTIRGSGKAKQRGCDIAKLKPPVSAFTLAISLHVLLVFVNVVLLAVYLDDHREHRLIVSLGEPANVLSVSIKAVAQTIVILYFGAMLALVQQVASRLNFVTKQEVTATHDNLVAWASIGSAITALTNQWKTRASVLGVSAVTLYLAGIAVLHVTTASLFTVQTFNETNLVNVDRTLAMQDLCASAWSSGGACPLDTSFLQQSQVIPAFSIFTGNLGLIGNTVYDAIHDNNATGSIPVNATTWTVDCGTIPAAASVQNCTGNYTFEDGSPVIAENGNYVIEIGVDGSNGLIAPVCMVPSVLPPLTVRTTPDFISNSTLNYVALGDTLFIYSTINITDSKGDIGTIVSLNPPMNATSNGDLNWALNMIACSAMETNHTIQVDAATKLPLNVTMNGYNAKTEATWKPWAVLNQTGSQMLNRFRQIFSTAVGGDDSQGTIDVEAGFGSTYPDWYILKDNANPSLFEVENSLANITAMMYWTSVQTQLDASSKAVATVPESSIAPFARVNLNAAPLFISFAVSILLLPLSLFLMGVFNFHRIAARTSSLPSSTYSSTTSLHLKGSDAQGIASSGLLEMIWLVENNPGLQRHFKEALDMVLEGEKIGARRNELDGEEDEEEDDVDDMVHPTEDQLRAAGVFKARLVGDIDGHSEPEHQHV